MSLVMYTGDLKPDLNVVCSADTAVNLTTATSVRILGKRNSVVVFDRTPTLAVVGDTTVASMLWQAGDTDNIGRISIEVEATWPGAKKQTFRADGGVDIRRDFDQMALLPPEGDLTAQAADAYVLAVLEYEGDAYDAIVNIAATTPGPPNGGAGGVLSGTYPNPGFAVNMAEQSELDTHVNDQLAHLPGRELGYAERLTNFTSTDTASFNQWISAFSVTVVGTGAPVDVEFFAPNVSHTVANAQVNIYLVVNDVAGGTSGQFAVVTATGATPSVFLKRRLVIPNAASWTFKIGVISASAGTATVLASTAKPMFLQATAR